MSRFLLCSTNRLWARSTRHYSSARRQRAIPQAPTISVLEPGLVHIKQALSQSQQKELASIVMNEGNQRHSGFWHHKPDGTTALNSTPHRGRMFKAVKSLPDNIETLCMQHLNNIHKHDPTLRTIAPTHAIMLYYKTVALSKDQAYIPWHQDNGDNDGDADHPVVSISLGDTCEFLVAKSRPKLSRLHPASNPVNLAHRIQYESGDMIVFGGPCRFIWHAIYQFHLETSPEFLPLRNARLNLTFRHTPKLLGREQEFATIPANDLPKDNPFFKISQMK